MASLYIVATPIGNLRDITLRALDTLNNADIIACEDTRRTGNLLRAHSIGKQLISCHSHNLQSGIRRICGFLRSGKDVAYTTDAGTPGVSDPGQQIIHEVRNLGYPVVPIPGPAAATTLLSAAGISGKMGRGHCEDD